MIRKPCSEETKTKISLSLKGHIVLDETRIKLSKGNRGKVRSDEFKNNQRIRMRLFRHSEDTKKRISHSLKGHLVSLETRLKKSQTMKLYWVEPDFAKKVLHRRTPSGPEQMFTTLCKKYDLPYQFVGNGELLIGRKNPDFVGTQDEHKLIEIWGERFKLGRNPQDLIDFYKVYGYQCLIIWANELLKYPDQVVEKIRRFV